MKKKELIEGGLGMFVVQTFFEMFEAKHWLLLTISDNVSANEELQAYEILNVEKK